MHLFKKVEEATLHTWPAIDNLVANGWVIRTSQGYTKRANSVSPLHFSADCDIAEQIVKCEEHFASLNQDAIFKMTPYVEPRNLDDILADAGYAVIDESSVQQVRLSEVDKPRLAARLERQIGDDWFNALIQCGGISETNSKILRRMLQNSSLPQGFATLYEEDIPVACGLGVIREQIVALYDIVTHPAYRRKGYGEQLVLNILDWARSEGAAESCLQVVKQNEGAVALYNKIGYGEIYPYWYRIKKLERS